MQIAIDGPAAAGKTSLGRALAEHFGCLFVAVSYTHLTLPTICSV